VSNPDPTVHRSPITERRVNPRRRTYMTSESVLPVAISAPRMEHLWSPAGATSGNRSQWGPTRERLKQADRQPVATHGKRFGAHGKGAPPEKGGVASLAPQEESKSCEPEGPQDLTTRIYHLAGRAATTGSDGRCGGGSGVGVTISLGPAQLKLELPSFARSRPPMQRRSAGCWLCAHPDSRFAIGLHSRPESQEARRSPGVI
jgi:hypothetical protein